MFRVFTFRSAALGHVFGVACAVRQNIDTPLLNRVHG